MVDRIVPATTPADRDEVETALGLRDEAAVLTEPFSQWVVEDRFVQGRPGWGRVGAQLVSDVRPYEIAKLRLLNGAHSALAYLGLQLGHSFVHEAIVDPAIRPLIERLMRQEASGSFKPASEQNIPSYTDTLLARFANAALRHRLDQISIDGSQKLPQRWLETLAENQGRGRQCPAILTALAAWLRHIRGDNGFVDDPLADRLCAIWRQAGAAGILDAVFGERGLISSPWRPSQVDCDFVAARLTKAKSSARSQLLL
jgi:fructuronate reductase